MSTDLELEMFGDRKEAQREVNPVNHAMQWDGTLNPFWQLHAKPVTYRSKQRQRHSVKSDCLIRYLLYSVLGLL